MTSAVFHDHIRATPGRTLAGVLLAVWSILGQASRRRRAMREIAALNDRTLADIGLSRPATFHSAYPEHAGRLTGF